MPAPLPDPHPPAPGKPPALGRIPRVAVVGAGVFGRNHLRNLRDLASAGIALPVAVVEPDPAARAQAAQEFNLPGLTSVDDLLTLGVDAAVIAVPTRAHAAVAAQLLGAGVACLVEKPFAATLAEAEALVELAHRRAVVLQVGHLERFNPAVRAAHAVLTRPMFFEAHRLSVFTPRSLDVDVVLDLMIHDLDIVLHMVGSPVQEVRAVGLPVLSRRVDIANARVEFSNGCVANFTASRVSTERVRKLRFFQPHQYVSVDFARQDVLLIDVSATEGLDLAQLAQAAAAHASSSPSEAATHPSPGLALRKLDVVTGEPLRLELEAFLRSVREGAPVEVPGEEGKAALHLALEIDRAIRDHAHRAGLDL